MSINNKEKENIIEQDIANSSEQNMYNSSNEEIESIIEEVINEDTTNTEEYKETERHYFWLNLIKVLLATVVCYGLGYIIGKYIF